MRVPAQVSCGHEAAVELWETTVFSTKIKKRSSPFLRSFPVDNSLDSDCSLFTIQLAHGCTMHNKIWIVTAPELTHERKRAFEIAAQ